MHMVVAVKFAGQSNRTIGMANVIRRVMAQRSGLREEGLIRWISSQPHAIDVHKEGAEVATATPVLPWAWSHEASARGISQLVAPKGKRLFLVDTLALVKRLESEGLTPKQSEAITAVITEVLNDSLENVGQTFTSIYEMQRSEMMADAALGKFKGHMQSSQDHHFAMLQQETERLRTDIDKMRNESKYAIDKVTSGQRLDLNLERGRIRDELSTQASETSNLTNKLDREIHTLKTQLEAAKFDVIKYCIGTIASVTAVGLGMLRLIM